MRLEDVKCGQIVRINHSLYGLVLGICLSEIDDSYTHFICQNKSHKISVLVYQICRFESELANDEITKELVSKLSKEALKTALNPKYCGTLYLETMTATGIKAKTEDVRIWLLKNKLQCVNLEHNTMEPELFVKEIGKIQSQIDSFVKKAKKCFEENIHKVNSVKEFKLGEVYWLQRGPYEIPNIVIYVKKNVFLYFKTVTFSKSMFVYDDENKNDFNFGDEPNIERLSDYALMYMI